MELLFAVRVGPCGEGGQLFELDLGERRGARQRAGRLFAGHQGPELSGGLVAGRGGLSCLAEQGPVALAEALDELAERQDLFFEFFDGRRLAHVSRSSYTKGGAVPRYAVM